MTAVFSGYSFFDVARGLWLVLFHAHCTTSKYAKQVLHDRFGDASDFCIYYERYWIRPRKQSHSKIRPKPSLKRSIPTPESIRGMGTSFRRNDFGIICERGGGEEASVNYDWLMVALNTIAQSLQTLVHPNDPRIHSTQSLYFLEIRKREIYLFWPTIGDKLRNFALKGLFDVLLTLKGENVAFPPPSPPCNVVPK